MTLNPFIYQSGGGGSGPILLVTVTGAAASSVVATKSGASVSLAYDSTAGKWWGVLPETGTWTVTAYNGTISSSSTTVSASNVTIYEATLQLSVLPSGFTELQYVTFSGAQYIDSGIDASQNYDVTGYVKFATAAQHEIYGVRTSDGAHRLEGDARSGQRKWLFYGKDYAWNTATGNTNGTCFENTAYNFEVKESSNEFILNGVSLTLTARTPGTVPAASFAIGAWNDSISGISNYLTGDLGLLTFGTTAKLHPAKRNSDSVVGYYDTIRANFYTNAGTGSLIAGPEL